MIKAEPVRYSTIVGSSIMLTDNTKKCIGVLSLLNVENKEKENKIIDFVVNSINEKNKKINTKLLKAEPFIDGDDFSIILRDNSGVQLIQLNISQFSNTNTLSEHTLESLTLRISNIINEKEKEERSKNAICDLFDY